MIYSGGIQGEVNNIKSHLQEGSMAAADDTRMLLLTCHAKGNTFLLVCHVLEYMVKSADTCEDGTCRCP